MNARGRSLVWVVVAWGSFLSPLRADDVGIRPSDIDSVFHIGNSGSRNEVHYAVHVSAACTLTGDAPLLAYWRDLEDGAHERSELTVLEERGYGIAYQRRAALSDGTTVLRVALRGLPLRELQVATRVVDGHCTADARMRIAGSRAVLDQIFVQTSGLFSVDWIAVQGHRLSDGQAVRERVEMPQS